jgi:NAD(P)-dependent dehydrogenase (short-subunit alcohol dehydrogenase family)
MYTGIILVAFLAIWLGMPHRQLDWNGEILPMAHEKMNLSTQTNTPLEDMIVVLTGSTSGIGLALTKTLVKLGAIVVALGRSETKLQAVQESLPINVEPIVADFNDLDSVTRACDLIQERFQRIDVLINNAGMHYKWESLHHPTTSQNYDQVFGVNYLSHFLLTERMIPLLNNSTIPTIVQISSSYHWAVDGSDLLVSENQKDPIAATPGATPVWFWRDQRAYANSKLAQILHMRSLQRLYPTIRMASVCPGWVGTQIAGVSGSLTHAMLNMLAFDANDWGMASTLHALLNASDTHHDYYINSNFANIFHYLVPLLSRPSMYKYGLRDAISMPLAFLMMAGQTFTTGVYATRSSPESYNTTLQDSLYEWSKKAIAPFLK